MKADPIAHRGFSSQVSIPDPDPGSARRGQLPHPFGNSLRRHLPSRDTCACSRQMIVRDRFRLIFLLGGQYSSS